MQHPYTHKQHTWRDSHPTRVQEKPRKFMQSSFKGKKNIQLKSQPNEVTKLVAAVRSLHQTVLVFIFICKRDKSPERLASNHENAGKREKSGKKQQIKN